MKGQINHIGLAVRDFDAAVHVYHDILGLPLSDIREIPERGMKIAFLEAGDTLLELMAPLDESSQIASFLERRGEGIHHICLETDDIRGELDRLGNAGLRLITKEPETGAEGHPVAFLHPKSCHGVLLELIEPTRKP